MQTTVKVIGRGQIVIPKPIREALDIKEGDLLNLKIEKVKKTNYS
jgi:AbrB family looped-hinge helix DNA binding protein